MQYIICKKLLPHPLIEWLEVIVCTSDQPVGHDKSYPWKSGGHDTAASGRTGLEPGEQVIIEFGLPTDMLNFTNSHGERIVEPGEFEIQIGESSAAIKFSAVATLVGEVRTLVRGWRMESSFEVKACAEDHAQ